MQSKQLGYIRQGNILRIAPLSAIRAETDSAKALLDAQKMLEPIKVKVIPISYSKAKDLEPQLQGFLSSRGSAKADDRTNSLVIRDIAENITRIDKLVQKLDTQTPQVYIEGKVVESKIANARNIGVEWASDASAAAAQYDLDTHVAQLNGILGLTAKLQLLESDEKIKILSSPRIVTLNNQEAKIEQSTQFPTYTTTVDPTTKQITKSVSYQTVHLSLKVTPQITAEGGVILNTEILREFAGSVDPIAPETGARSLNARSAKSSILVHNGQTAVLGGIYSTDNTASNAGIPLLREIPLLGWLFGHDQITYDKNELLIFLTPRVINKDKAFQLSGAGSDNETL
jgi:type IV pilus assembly protein PilQ